MSSRRFSVGILALLSLSCGGDRIDGYGGRNALLNRRIGQVVGYAMTPQQLAQEEQFRDHLTGDLWVGIDADQKPIPGTGVRFFTSKYSPEKGLYSFEFEMALNGEAMRGRTHFDRTTDGAVRGFIDGPDVSPIERLCLMRRNAGRHYGCYPNRTEHYVGTNMEFLPSPSDPGTLLVHLNERGLREESLSFQPSATILKRVKDSAAAASSEPKK
jgi:hypothetical protein